MQTYQSHLVTNQAATAAPAANNMASFVARLMSLNAHELQCLHSDSEIMRHLAEAQLLMESRLQDINFHSKFNALHHQQQQLSSPTSYYDYYAQAISNQHYSGQQQQQQQQHQQQHHHHQQQLLALANSSHLSHLALDLRTTGYAGHQLQPTGGFFAASSPQNSHYGSSSSAASSPADLAPQSLSVSMQQQHQRPFNPKKMKLNEYQQQQQQQQQHHHHHQDSNSSYTSTCSSGAASGQVQSNNNNNNTVNVNNALAIRLLTPSDSHELAQGNQQQTSQQQQQLASPLAAAQPSTKKYKGEFDEPTPSEVEERQRMLAKEDNYHDRCWKTGDCACVMGSEFNGKSAATVLNDIDHWRHLDTEERIKSKWDVGDLPKVIELSDIKKYEDLRRDASNGKADFGGASKRKPVGIRGTRQFLLILYCLWGHPGRDDVMQKEGYCPHCFAKIKKANEQSTLVRVVNHFNMKHRRGANPRLSPYRDTPIEPQVAQTTSVSEEEERQHQQQLREHNERDVAAAVSLTILCNGSSMADHQQQQRLQHNEHSREPSPSLTNSNQSTSSMETGATTSCSKRPTRSSPRESSSSSNLETTLKSEP